LSYPSGVKSDLTFGSWRRRDGYGLEQGIKNDLSKLDDIVQGINAIGRSITILIDALDEAADGQPRHRWALRLQLGNDRLWREAVVRGLGRFGGVG
jgi:hypothetical protein